MTAAIRYCSRCGRRLHEAASNNAPADELFCATCKGEPKAPLQDPSATQLHRIADVRAQLGQAEPPRQLFPAPGEERPPDQTSPSLADLRAQILAELRHGSDDELKALQPPQQSSNEKTAGVLGGESWMEPQTGVDLPEIPPELLTGRLPHNTKQAIYAVAGATVLLLGMWLFWPVSSKSDKARQKEPAAKTALSSATPASVPTRKTEEPPAVKKPAEPNLAEVLKAAVETETREEEQRFLREVEAILDVAGERPPLATAERALMRLRGMSEQAPLKTRAKILEAIARFEQVADDDAREQVRKADEESLAAEKAGRGAEALKLVKKAGDAMSEFSPWAKTEGRKRLDEIAERIGRGREASLHSIEEAVKKAEIGAADGSRTSDHRLGLIADARYALAHVAAKNDPEQAADLERLRERLAAVEQKAVSLNKAQKEDAYKAWTAFFRDFDARLKRGDVAGAVELCSPPPNSPLRFETEVIEKPADVLAAFAADAQSLAGGRQAAADAAGRLAAAGVSVQLTLENAGPERKAAIVRMENGRLIAAVERGVQMSLEAEKLSAAMLTELFAQVFSEAERAKYAAGLRLLRDAAGDPNLNADPPLFHRQQREAFLKRAKDKTEWRQTVAQLRAALERKNAEEVRRLLVRVDAASPEAARTDDEAETRIVAEARALAAAYRREVLVFQNGGRPTEDYLGMRWDAITSRGEPSSTRDNPGVRLRLGSHGGLHRFLLRFDGLTETLMGARVLKATLSLYQTEGDPGDGAEVGLFRLLKPWRPGAGDWQNYNRGGGLKWDVSGATSPKDALPRADAVLRLDSRRGVWRSWDVTSFVSDVAAGRDPNHGLLFKIVRDEPRYAVLFSAVATVGKDEQPELRPLLTIEVERGGDVANQK